MIQQRNRAVFFDRDGVVLKVVIENGTARPPQSVAEYKKKSGIMPGAREAIEMVKAAGFLAILVTNQPDLHYGVITQKDFDSIQGDVAALSFNDIFICFHGREEGCVCKKPRPGMLLAAAKKWNIDLAQSFMIGDLAMDVGAARAAGCKTILIDCSYNKDVDADRRVATIQDAAHAALS